MLQLSLSLFFFFNDTATTEIYTLSLHDALPIWAHAVRHGSGPDDSGAENAVSCHAEHHPRRRFGSGVSGPAHLRSEEHTSELQSRQYLVCRLLLEKKKKEKHHTQAKDIKLEEER